MALQRRCPNAYHHTLVSFTEERRLLGLVAVCMRKEERERERGREGGGGKRLRYLRRNGMKCMQTKRVSFLFHDINPISSLFDTIQMCDPKTHPPPLGRWGGGEVGRTQPSRSSRPPRFWGRAPRRPRRPPYRACLPCRACRRACRLACRRARPRHPRLRPGTSC